MSESDASANAKPAVTRMEATPDPAHGWVFDRRRRFFRATVRIVFLERVVAYRSPLRWSRLNIEGGEEGWSLGFAEFVMRRLDGEEIFEAGQVVELALDLYEKLADDPELDEFPAGPATLSIGFDLYARDRRSDTGLYVEIPIEVI